MSDPLSDKTPALPEYAFFVKVYDRSSKEHMCTLNLGTVSNLAKAERQRMTLANENPDKVFVAVFNQSVQLDLPF